MKIHPIEIASEKLPRSLWNIAMDFKEGRNVLIRCLSRNSKRSELEVIEWLKANGKVIKDLDDYIIKDIIDEVYGEVQRRYRDTLINLGND